MPKVTASMLPLIRLTPDHERELRELSTNLEQCISHEYETLLLDQHDCVDQSVWQPMNSEEHLQTFRQRRGTTRTTRLPSCPLVLTRTRPENVLEAGLRRAVMQSGVDMLHTMVSGTVAGTLDDALLAVSFDDTATMRERSGYEGNFSLDGKVITTMDSPSRDDPFQFTGIIWNLKQLPFGGIIRSRDMVMLAQIRQSTLPRTGHRIGLMFFHSVDHEDAPAFQKLGTVRLHGSMAMLFRQRDANRVDVFGFTCADPGGHAPNALIAHESSRILLASGNVYNVSIQRKLARMLRDPLRRRSNAQGSTTSDPAANARCCAVCDARMGAGVFRSRATVCRLCNSPICSKCSVRTSLVVPTDDNRVETKSFEFCLACTLRAKQFPARQLANMCIHHSPIVERVTWQPPMPPIRRPIQSAGV